MPRRRKQRASTSAATHTPAASRHAGASPPSPAPASATATGTATACPPAVGEMVVGTLKSAVAFRVEILALIRSDLRRMPDVRALITEHLHATPGLQEMLMEKLPRQSLLDLARDKWQHLPDAQSFIVRHLDHIPAWRDFLHAHAPSLSSADPQEVFGSLQGLSWPRLELPPALSERFHGIPSVREALADWIKRPGPLLVDSGDVQGVIAEHGSQIPELFQLINANIERLPNLTRLLHIHYLADTPALKHYDFVPSFMKNNEYIRTGYRPELVSFKRTLASLFYVHNDTVNIYSHLIGALVFVMLAVDATLYVVDANRPWLDLLALQCFFVSAMVCLLSSAAFHTLVCHSSHVQTWACKLDFFGITALICGSAMSINYFMFYCDSNHMAFYWAYMAVAGILSTYGTFCAESDVLRTSLFILLGAAGLTPCFHYTYLYGLDMLVHALDLKWVLFIQCPLYLTGAAVYIARVPECIFPGKFDIWLHSHQIWHGFVIAAAIAHYVGMYNMYLNRKENGCAAEDSFHAAAAALL